MAGGLPVAQDRDDVITLLLTVDTDTDAFKKAKKTAEDLQDIPKDMSTNIDDMLDAFIKMAENAKKIADWLKEAYNHVSEMAAKTVAMSAHTTWGLSNQERKNLNYFFDNDAIAKQYGLGSESILDMIETLQSERGELKAGGQLNEEFAKASSVLAQMSGDSSLGGTELSKTISTSTPKQILEKYLNALDRIYYLYGDDQQKMDHLLPYVRYMTDSGFLSPELLAWIETNQTINRQLKLPYQGKRSTFNKIFSGASEDFNDSDIDKRVEAYMREDVEKQQRGGLQSAREQLNMSVYNMTQSVAGRVMEIEADNDTILSRVLDALHKGSFLDIAKIGVDFSPESRSSVYKTLGAFDDKSNPYTWTYGLANEIGLDPRLYARMPERPDTEDDYNSILYTVYGHDTTPDVNRERTDAVYPIDENTTDIGLILHNKAGHILAADSANVNYSAYSNAVLMALEDLYAQKNFTAHPDSGLTINDWRLKFRKDVQTEGEEGGEFFLDAEHGASVFELMDQMVKAQYMTEEQELQGLYSFVKNWETVSQFNEISDLIKIPEGLKKGSFLQPRTIVVTDSSGSKYDLIVNVELREEDHSLNPFNHDTHAIDLNGKATTGGVD